MSLWGAQEGKVEEESLLMRTSCFHALARCDYGNSDEITVPVHKIVVMLLDLDDNLMIV